MSVVTATNHFPNPLWDRQEFSAYHRAGVPFRIDTLGIDRHHQAHLGATYPCGSEEYCE
jgi:hypothetical protein